MDRKKYIVEASDDVKKVMAMGVTHGGAIWTDTTDIENLEELNSDYINEHFGDMQDEAYKRGFEDGKGAINKGCEGCRFEGTRCTACENCCNSHMNHWTAKDDKIEVGDEVEWDNEFGDRFVVTRIYQPYGQKEQCDGIGDDGDVCRAVLIENLVKTGRHFDIDKILEALKE